MFIFANWLIGCVWFFFFFSRKFSRNKWKRFLPDKLLRLHITDEKEKNMKEKTLSIYKVARKYTGNINFIYNSMYNIWEQAILLTIQYLGEVAEKLTYQ